MTYQELGYMLFPLWLGGCFFALIINSIDWRMFGLTAFYMFFAIGGFQLRFDGMAPIYGMRWYELVSIVQLLVIAMTYVTRARASGAVRTCAIGIVCVCGLYAAGALLHRPLPKGGYFVGINAFQALQVLSLIGFSPMWSRLQGFIKSAWSRIGSHTWLRIAPSGQI